MRFILVVDEEPMILELIATVLRNAGFSVLTANTSSEALALEQQYRGEIKLLITDIGIPQMDGPNFAGRFMADPGLSVLFLSATTSESTSESGFIPQQRTALLAKPFDPRELLAHAKALMAGSFALTAG
jgi:two-component system, cell cycle sensor histidine kinase and response regulator CckA